MTGNRSRFGAGRASRMAAATLMLLASAASGGAPRQSFDIAIPLLSGPVRTDGRTMFAFEIHATNLSDEPLTFQEIRLRDGDSGDVLAAFDRAALEGRIHVFQPVSTLKSPALTVGVGQRAMLYIEFDLPHARRVRAIRTELAYNAAGGATHIVQGEAVAVDPTPTPVLAPPLRGGPWVAVHDPSWERGHRRVAYTLAGKMRLPGRFAIDWVGTDANGKTSHGDSDRPADTIGYGAAVLAGADAVVAAIRDGMIESGSISGNPPHALGEGSGNYVVLRLSKNRFAFYEHLRTGSVAVQPGDRVHEGQVIGALGSTGDTTGPHLHLHVADCPSPLACEGVPFAIRGMTELGRYGRISDLGMRPPSPSAKGPLAAEWPGYNVVVNFRR